MGRQQAVACAAPQLGVRPFFLALLHHLDALKVRRALSFTLLAYASGFCFCLTLSGFFLFTLAFFLCCFGGGEVKKTTVRRSRNRRTFLRSLLRLLCFAEGLFRSRRKRSSSRALSTVARRFAFSSSIFACAAACLRSYSALRFSRMIALRVSNSGMMRERRFFVSRLPCGRVVQRRCDLFGLAQMSHGRSPAAARSPSRVRASPPGGMRARRGRSVWK
jgi:hypothetical protein